jgi:basic membrane lipoprotein Med (substrate-binding protein (PBP1-ABC) superfamily)
VVGSAVIDLPRAFLLVAEEVKSGRFTPKEETFGLASGVIRYVPNPRLDSIVPTALKARVAAAADSIAKGTLAPLSHLTSMRESGGSPQRHREHREELFGLFSVYLCALRASVVNGPVVRTGS